MTTKTINCANCGEPNTLVHMQEHGCSDCGRYNEGMELK